MKPRHEMRWRRRQAKWKTYRLHRTRWIYYSTPRPSGPSWVEDRFLSLNPESREYLTLDEARAMWIREKATRP